MTGNTTPTGTGINAGPRTIKAIATDITEAWGDKVYFAAKPYLDAMHSLDTMDDAYGADSAETIVRYFLSNAAQFKGAQARQLKEELRALLPKRR